VAYRMYFVALFEGTPEDVRERAAEQIALRQGFVLMATGRGSLIALMDEAHVDAVRGLQGVELVGPVQIDPEGPAAVRLQRLFAERLRQQVGRRP